MDAMSGAPSNKVTYGRCVEPENISYCRKFLNVARNVKQQQSMSAGPLSITQRITVPLAPPHKARLSALAYAAKSKVCKVWQSAILTKRGRLECPKLFKLVNVMLVRAITPLWRASNRNYAGEPPEQPGTSAEWTRNRQTELFRDAHAARLTEYSGILVRRA